MEHGPVDLVSLSASYSIEDEDFPLPIVVPPQKVGPYKRYKWIYGARYKWRSFWVTGVTDPRS